MNNINSTAHRVCGHTHHEAEIEISGNLKVIVGGADYGTPSIQRTFVIQLNQMFKSPHRHFVWIALAKILSRDITQVVRNPSQSLELLYKAL